MKLERRDGRNYLKGEQLGEVIDDLQIDGIEWPKKKGKFKIINSTGPTEALQSWKKYIAERVIEKGLNRLTPGEGKFAISLSLYFKQGFHGPKFDIDNFVKPIIDGIAKGLVIKSLPKDGDVSFNEDDSVFRWCYFERQESNKEKEYVFITVWRIN